MTPRRSSSAVARVWLVRNPSEPSENEMTGGMARWNSDDACRIVPSPPRQTTKSTYECNLHSSRGASLEEVLL